MNEKLEIQSEEDPREWLISEIERRLPEYVPLPRRSDFWSEYNYGTMQLQKIIKIYNNNNTSIDKAIEAIIDIADENQEKFDCQLYPVTLEAAGGEEFSYHQLIKLVNEYQERIGYDLHKAQRPEP